MVLVNSINDMLSDWLAQVLGTRAFEIRQLMGDASARQYYRVLLEDTSYIVMLVLAEEYAQDLLERFVTISGLLSQKGVVVPEVLSRAPDGRSLLLSDLGDTQYLMVLNEKTVELLYRDAVQVLLNLQKHIPRNLKYSHALGLPVMTVDFMRDQVDTLFWGWFVDRFLGGMTSQTDRDLVDQTIDTVLWQIDQQPKAFTHMDFHSRNLMVIPEHNPGVLDFQDAMWGPITYDLASLFQDCYISWPCSKIEVWLRRYYLRLINTNGIYSVSEDFDYETFRRWFHYAALQRHLKNLGIFARLHVRDGKSSYLQELPRIFENIMLIFSASPELAPLEQYFQKDILPVAQAVLLTCVLEQPCEP